MRCKIPDRDLQARLDRTFCLYEGRPYYIIVDVPYINLHDIPSQNFYKTIKSNDPLFDISTIPLGYMQYSPERVVYLSRTPGRIFKQGVNLDNLKNYFLDPTVRGGKIDVFCKEFVSLIEGKYPLVTDALQLLQEDKTYREIAVSRDIALVRNDLIIIVYFKNKQVGWIPPNQQIVIVPSTDNAWVISRYLSELKWEVR